MKNSLYEPMLYKQVPKNLIRNNEFDPTSKAVMVCQDVVMKICIYTGLLKEVVFLMVNMLLSLQQYIIWVGGVV